MAQESVQLMPDACGGRDGGGQEALTCRVCCWAGGLAALLGVLHLELEAFLLVVTEAVLVGRVCGALVWGISQVELLPFDLQPTASERYPLHPPLSTPCPMPRRPALASYVFASNAARGLHPASGQRRRCAALVSVPLRSACMYTFRDSRAAAACPAPAVRLRDTSWQGRWPGPHLSLTSRAYAALHMHAYTAARAQRRCSAACPTSRLPSRGTATTFRSSLTFPTQPPPASPRLPPLRPHTRRQPSSAAAPAPGAAQKGRRRAYGGTRACCRSLTPLPRPHAATGLRLSCMAPYTPTRSRLPPSPFSRAAGARSALPYSHLAS